MPAASVHPVPTVTILSASSIDDVGVNVEVNTRGSTVLFTASIVPLGVIMSAVVNPVGASVNV